MKTQEIVSRLAAEAKHKTLKTAAAAIKSGDIAAIDQAREACRELSRKECEAGRKYDFLQLAADAVADVLRYEKYCRSHVAAWADEESLEEVLNAAAHALAANAPTEDEGYVPPSERGLNSRAYSASCSQYNYEQLVRKIKRELAC